jgi:hypothetical protein
MLGCLGSFYVVSSGFRTWKGRVYLGKDRRWQVSCGFRLIRSTSGSLISWAFEEDSFGASGPKIGDSYVQILKDGVVLLLDLSSFEPLNS